MKAYALFLGMVLTFGSLALNLQAPGASALSGSSFQPGYIIDDQVFYDSESMTVQQIQNFLVANVPNCDTGGNLPYFGTYNGVTYNGNILRKNLDPNFPPPYTCLKDYAENPTTHASNYGGMPVPVGAVGSAQIILNAAQTYGINPKVLLTLIQKESGLVTDDWPWLNEYSTATGYGCPDTGPNGTADCNANYYGFYNQVTDAASQFRQYATNSSSYNFVPAVQLRGPSNPSGEVNILYHPAPSSCGSEPVVIDNQATASLYEYTPYVPNQAALSNLYGTGDSCSSYGNRNFWRIFNVWFGSTIVSNNLPPSANSDYARSACDIPNYSTNYVGRLYQPNSGDYVYTASSAEACSALKYGYIWDGLAFQTYTGTGAIPVYRVRGDGYHIFTADLTIRNDYLLNPGFVSEGIAFDVSATSQTGLMPVTAMSSNTTTLYTTSSGEANFFQGAYGYVNSGIAFYVDPVLPSTTLPVMRLQKSGSYLYTLDMSEKSSAVSNFGYTYEGTAFNANNADSGSSLPVYRLRRGNSYFYTIDRAERDQAVTELGYLSEGTGFYVPATSSSSTTDVLRLVSPSGSHLYTIYPSEAAAAVAAGYTQEGLKFFAL